MSDAVSGPPADDQAARAVRDTALRHMLAAENREIVALQQVDALSGLLRGMARRASEQRREARAEYIGRQVAEQNLRYAPLSGIEAYRVEVSAALIGYKAMPPVPAVIRAADDPVIPHHSDHRWWAEAASLHVENERLRSMMAERTAAVGDAANRYMAERARVAAVRALADDLPDLLQAYAWSHQDGTWLGYAEFIAGRIRAVLDGDAEAPADGWWTAHRLDVWECDEDDWRWRCSCGTGGFVYVTEQLAQAAADAHAAEPVSVGPAEAAEPAPPMQPAPAMTAPQILARLSELDAQAEANPDPRPLGDPVQMVGRYPVRAADAGTPEPAHDGDTCAETDQALDDAHGDLNTVTEYLDRNGVSVGLYRTVDGLNYRIGIEALIEKRLAAGIVTTTPADPGRHPLTAFADDIEQRMPNLRDPDPLSDWGKGVAWAVDRARNMAADSNPALIGTWADPAFVAHQYHKYPVDGCGYCPQEEDR